MMFYDRDSFREEDDWISDCRSIEMAGKRGKGRPTKTCRECIKNDVKAKGLMALNISVWSKSILRKTSQPCKNVKRTLNDDNDDETVLI